MYVSHVYIARTTSYLYLADIKYSLTAFRTSLLGLVPCLASSIHSSRFRRSSLEAIQLMECT